MKLEVDIPDDIGRSLENQASSAGQELIHWVRCVLIDVAHHDAKTGSGSPRLPDPPLEPVEISAPFDLPRSGQQTVVTPSAHLIQARRPDMPDLSE